MTEHTSTETIISTKPDEPHNDSERKPFISQKFINRAIGGAVLILIYAHFIWATLYFIRHSYDKLGPSLCHGYGFWVIIFCFINFGLWYKYILSKTVVPIFYKFVWKPWIKFFRKIKYGQLIFLLALLGGILSFLVVDTIDDPYRLMPLSGIAVFIIIGFLLCPYKKHIPWNTVLSGLIAQFVLGLLMIRWEVGRNIFSCVGDRVDTFLNYAVNASAFVYGEELVIKQAIFAFNALAAIYLMSFFINILYYYGIMQSIVLNLGILLQGLLGTPICESVNSAGNIFLGMSESPFLLKPYLDHLTDSEIHSIMTSGFASVSGTVLAAYISFGANAADLVTSCVMSAPAALCYSKLMYPEVEEVTVHKENIKKIEMKFESVLDAAIKGAGEASQIVLGIIANLISFIACVYFINGVLSWLGTLVGFVNEGEIWSLELILGKILIPMAYTMGVDWDECERVGQLIGIKTVVNEFVAFQNMKTMLDLNQLNAKSKIIATYAICGFANPGSMGIAISTLSAFMPKNKHRVTKVIFRAYIGGSFAAFMTACIAALLTP